MIETITVRDDLTGRVLIQATRRTESPRLGWRISGPIAPAFVAIPNGTLAVIKQEVRRLAKEYLGNWMFTTTVERTS